jgi:hypothetical protein
MLVENVFDTFSFLPIDAFMVFAVGKKSVNYEIRKASVFLVSQLLKELFKLWDKKLVRKEAIGEAQAKSPRCRGAPAHSETVDYIPQFTLHPPRI